MGAPLDLGTIQIGRRAYPLNRMRVRPVAFVISAKGGWESPFKALADDAKNECATNTP